MTTFVLVHGAWHDSWCWGRVAERVTRAGHDVVVPDLPSDDGTADFDDYADVVCGAIDGRHADDIVVVGHSLGGATAALVAARHPARHLVYLCASVPESGVSLLGLNDIHPDLANPGWANGLSKPDEQLRTVWVDHDFARHVFYGDCDDATVAAAIDHLRPQSAYPWTVPCSLSEPPRMSCTYVVCSDDQMVRPSYQRRIARQIGADVVELTSSHSPLLSQPAAVAEVLLRVAG